MDAKGAKRRERAHKQRARDCEARARRRATDATKTNARRLQSFAIGERMIRRARRRDDGRDARDERD